MVPENPVKAVKCHVFSHCLIPVDYTNKETQQVLHIPEPRLLKVVTRHFIHKFNTKLYNSQLVQQFTELIIDSFIMFMKLDL